MLKLQKNIYENSQRTILMDAVPLEVPLCVCIEPSNICNFKCRMCFHGNNETDPKAKPLQNMPSDIFDKTLNDMKAWVSDTEKKIKLVKLYSLGEPLLHPDICDWIKRLKEADVCDSIEITTNGSLLSKDVAEKMVNYGLDTLRISVYGVTDQEQKRVTQSHVSPEEIRNNVKYLQEYKAAKHKNYPTVYAKMIDMHNDESEKFIKSYTGIADQVGLDEAFELTSGEEDVFSKMFGDDNAVSAHKASLDSNIFKERKVCRYPFTHMTIRSDGTVVVCCADWLKETAYGNIKEHSLKDLWQSKSLYDFRCDMLEYRGADKPCCRRCEIPYRDTPEDNLDDFPVKKLSYLNEY